MRATCGLRETRPKCSSCNGRGRRIASPSLPEARDRMQAQRRGMARCRDNARGLVNLGALQSRFVHVATGRPVLPTEWGAPAWVA